MRPGRASFRTQDNQFWSQIKSLETQNVSDIFTFHNLVCFFGIVNPFLINCSMPSLAKNFPISCAYQIHLISSLSMRCRKYKGPLQSSLWKKAETAALIVTDFQENLSMSLLKSLTREVDHFHFEKQSRFIVLVNKKK